MDTRFYDVGMKNMDKLIQGFLQEIVVGNILSILIFFDMLYCDIYSVRFFIVIITNMKSAPQGYTHKPPYISTNPVSTSLPSHGPSINRPAMVSATSPINTIDPERLKKEITYLEKTMM